MIDYNKVLNPKVLNVKPSGIRKFFDIAESMEEVISLGVGEPDFQTPWHIRQAGIASLQEGKTRYTSNWGLKALREEISKYIKNNLGVEYCPENEILVSVGGSEAIDAAIRALVTTGDEVIIPQPSFVCYTPITELSGGIPVIIPMKAENDFKLTADELRAHITDKTKVLILPFPGNPTGGIMEEKDLLEIAEVLRDTDIMVISDEIYSELTYSGKHSSIISIDGMRERTVLINGFSKTYSMTGWRLGYACGPAPVLQQMTKIHQFAIMSAPSTSQYAAIEALKNGRKDIEEMLEEYDTRRRFVVHTLRKMGLDCHEPLGAFYVFPSIKKTGMSSDEFCEKLLCEKHVAIVPGTAFGDSGEGYVRVSYCYSVEHLKEALRRIEEFLKENNLIK